MTPEGVSLKDYGVFAYQTSLGWKAGIPGNDGGNREEDEDFEVSCVSVSEGKKVMKSLAKRVRSSRRRWSMVVMKIMLYIQC